MERSVARCVVVGGANVDIGGFPAGMVVMGDSNPGCVRLSAGGVGRNIACALARLGVETHLLAALGEDAFTGIIRADCARAGVGLSHALVFRDMPCSTYLFIADEAGDMRLAVNDMSVCDRLTPEALEPSLDWLNGMDMVVLDANLPPDTLEYLAREIQAPLIADAVSAAKAPRLLPILPKLRAIKPNALEASALTGLPVRDGASAAKAAQRLLALGVGQAFITLGERGVCCAGPEGTHFIPGAPVRMVNATGAGDAFTAALAWGALRGMDTRATALAGLAAAAVAVESPETVSPNLSEAALLARMNNMTSTDQEVVL